MSYADRRAVKLDYKLPAIICGQWERYTAALNRQTDSQSVATQRTQESTERK